MAYTLIWSPPFVRSARKFLRAHANLRSRFDRVLADLAEDPHEPYLDLHALHGDLQGYHAVRLTYEYRIILVLRLSERRIILADIGSHDDVYR